MLSRWLRYLLVSLKNSIRQPERRWQQLQVGVGIFFVALATIALAAYLQWQWLFYIGVVIFFVAILFVLPAYLALLIWRLTDRPRDNNEK